MKLIFSTFTLAVLMCSCGGDSAKDIKTDDIEDACDCVDAMHQIMDEMIDLVQTYEDVDEADIPEEIELEYEALESKLDDVSGYCKDNFTKEAAQECNGFDELKDKAEKTR